MRWVVMVLLAACAGTTSQVPVERPASVLGNIEASTDLDGAIVGASDARATIAIVFASWCEHCKTELAVIDGLRSAHPRTRILGINVRAHEEYAARGSAAAVRAYVATSAPWLRVVPADDALFAALGRPPKVPTIYVFDAAGAVAARFDRRERAMPDASELAALLARLGG
ncbi:MAG: alkyl hydroperoxide reductase/thiol specific antioxidant/Mal allergen [Myxococcales bacterium]|nr:alkyl hydroperoxide reductase/thiol specific antioxidant/Mal allergen [Myxococcales bacterium]